jgi:hypothetical protein
MNPERRSGRWGRALFLGAATFCLPVLPETQATPGGIRDVPSTAEDAQRFFTNVADRLLQSQLGMNLARIQVHPTNQYCPAVHRILQVAANLVDATTNTPVPSVFRPQFGPHPAIPGAVAITGYVPDNDAATADPNPYGIPYVIGPSASKHGLRCAFGKPMLQALCMIAQRRLASRARAGSGRWDQWD